MRERMGKESSLAGVALSDELLAEIVGGLVVSDGGVDVYIVEPGHGILDVNPR